jgi:RNA polymerase sigma factor (TIGR02999 family)
VNQKSGPAEITALLKRWTGGDRDALARVLPLVYAELRRIAARQLSSEDAAHSIDPTDLVHALYLELVEQRRATWLNRTQFFAVVAQMMRRILVDHARARLAAKRSGTTVTISLPPGSDPAASDSRLTCCQSTRPSAPRGQIPSTRIVELRFAGLD